MLRPPLRSATHAETAEQLTKVLPIDPSNTRRFITLLRRLRREAEVREWQNKVTIALERRRSTLDKMKQTQKLVYTTGRFRTFLWSLVSFLVWW